MDNCYIFTKPQTYGELLEAIENTKKRIEEIKLTQGDDIENYLDYELHLISLEKNKKYNEKLYEMGCIVCKECGSTNIETIQYHDVEKLMQVYETKCHDCGHLTRAGIDDIQFRECIKFEQVDLLKPVFF